MTRALRTRHRRTLYALALLLPLALLLALAVRPAPPPATDARITFDEAGAR